MCVDLKTGQRKWHFQFVHHPIWNYDMSSAPILADITVNGRAIKAVARRTAQLQRRDHRTIGVERERGGRPHHLQLDMSGAGELGTRGIDVEAHGLERGQDVAAEARGVRLRGCERGEGAENEGEGDTGSGAATQGGLLGMAQLT